MERGRSIATAHAARMAFASACEVIEPSSDGSIVIGGVLSSELPLAIACVLTVPHGVHTSPLHVDAHRSVTATPGDDSAPMVSGDVGNCPGCCCCACS